MDTLFPVAPSNKGIISIVYVKLSSLQMVSLDALREACQADLNLLITNTEWSDKFSINSLLINLCQTWPTSIQSSIKKCFSKARIAKMYPGIDSSCNRWDFSHATLAHTLWFCQRPSGYWVSIFNALSKVFKGQINPNPLKALFGYQREDDHLPWVHFNCIPFVTVL